jgi:thiopeptide-type bacteriocin biosynthesis protein
VRGVSSIDSDVISRRDRSLDDIVTDGRPGTFLDLLRALLSAYYPSDAITREHCRRFVAAGVAALERAESPDSWVQLGLAPQSAWRDVYARLADTVPELLADPLVTNFFFMHKPPGLRVRFQVDPAYREEFGAALTVIARGWRDAGLVGEPVSGVYEPEQHLFGGHESMGYVHRLFTIDAVTWLDFHRHPRQGPAWAFSLILLRQIADGLGIVGWEDLEVWHRIQRQGGRRLPDEFAGERVAIAAAGIRGVWADPDLAHSRLSDEAITLSRTRGAAMRAAADEWLRGYFSDAAAAIGPREAMAFYVIFHWNRGTIPSLTQALLTAALADRSARP